MSTGIEWTDETWNPVTGCTKVSEGCANCYAERMARRLAGRYGYPEAPNHFDVTLHPDRLEEPLHWRKPRRVFVCSMGDLFHEDVPEEYIWQVIEIAWEAKEHTFQILTKRPERMLEVLTRSMWWLNDTPRNIWLGVTAENQQAADERREYLRHCPAAIKYVSYEPAIGPIDWTGWEFVDWVISGGESGSRARPSHPDWHRDTRDFCQRNGIAYFFKQWGAWAPTRPLDREEWVKRGGAPEHKEHHPWEFDRVGKKRAGRLLDGREWSQYPEA